jgi:hypothetical protein
MPDARCEKRECEGDTGSFCQLQEKPPAGVPEAFPFDFWHWPVFNPLWPFLIFAVA